MHFSRKNDDFGFEKNAILEPRGKIGSFLVPFLGPLLGQGGCQRSFFFGPFLAWAPGGGKVVPRSLFGCPLGAFWPHFGAPGLQFSLIFDQFFDVEIVRIRVPILPSTQRNVETKKQRNKEKRTNKDTKKQRNVETKRNKERSQARWRGRPNGPLDTPRQSHWRWRVNATALLVSPRSPYPGQRLAATVHPKIHVFLDSFPNLIF